MSGRRVIALTGISGVGKSTTLTQASKLITFIHLQASELIKAERERQREVNLDHDSLRETNISSNQFLLIQGFGRVVPESGLIILDGHVLIDTPNGLIEIKSEVFRILGVDKFIVLTDNPEEIYQHRLRDGTRRRPNRSIEELRVQQEQSIIVAHRIALELHIPLLILPSVTDDEFIQALR